MVDIDWGQLTNTGVNAGASLLQAYLNSQSSGDASDAVVGGYQEALNSLQGMIEQGQGDLTDGYGAAINSLISGSGTINDLLTTGQTGLKELLTAAAEQKDVGYQQTAQGMADALTSGVGGAGQELLTSTADQLEALGLTESQAMEILNKKAFNSRDALVQGYTKAFGNIDEGLADALGLAKAGGYNFGGIKSLFDEYTGKASDKLDPYEQTGRLGLNLEAALIGAQGPEAQSSAFKNYMASPGQKYLRDKQEESLLRNQAAIGGLQGGRVRTALQEQAKEIASTNLQQDISNLRNLATRGQQAATTQGGFYQESGANMGALRAQLEKEAMAERTKVNLAKANMAMDAARQKAQLTGQGTESMSKGFLDSGRDMASLIQNLGILETDITGNLGTRLSELELEYGAGIGSIIEKLGDLQTGNIDNLSTNLAKIDSTTLNNIIANVGNTTEGLVNLNTGLGTALMNASLGQGTNIAALLSEMGYADAAGIQGQNNSFQSALNDFGQIYGNVDWEAVLGGGTDTNGGTDFDSHWSNYTPDVGGGY